MSYHRRGLLSSMNTIKPALDLRFADRGVLDSRITATVDADATYFDGAGVLRTVSGANVARFDHVYDGAVWVPRGLLVEESRANFLPRSEDITTTWTDRLGTPVKTSNTTVAPDGNTTADTVEDDASGFESILSGNVLVANSQTFTASVYVLKDAIPPSTRFPLLRMRYTGGTATLMNVRLDTQSGAITSSLTGTGTLVDAGAVDSGDWWRVWVTGTNNATGNNLLNLEYLPAEGANADLTTASGSATGSTVVWGFMAELGDFLTSYIATPTDLVVTRADDVYTMLIADEAGANPFAGTVFVEADMNAVNHSALQYTFHVDDGTADNRFRMYMPGDTDDIAFGTLNSGGNNGFVQVSGLVARTVFRFAVAFAQDDVAGTLNGGAMVTDSTADLPLSAEPITIRLGIDVNSGRHLNGHLARITHWLPRLPDGLLQEMSTL